MTIERVKLPEWGLGDKLEPEHVEAFEDRVTSALDKRAGRTDTLASDITVTGELEVEGPLLIKGPTIVHSDAELQVDANTEFNGFTLLHHAQVDEATVSGKLSTESGGRIELGDNDYPQLSPGHDGRTVVRRITPIPIAQSESNQGDGFGSSGLQTVGTGGVVTLTAAGTTFSSIAGATGIISRFVLFDLTPFLLDGATVTSVAVNVRGAAGHAGLPERKPRIIVARFSGMEGYERLHVVEKAEDPSPLVPDYQLYHPISVNCNQHNVVDKSNATYLLAVYNEGGTNALVGLTIREIFVTMMITDLRPG